MSLGDLNVPEDKKVLKNKESLENSYSVEDVENMLEGIFKKVKGVGKVEVKITVKSGYENVYAYNVDESRIASSYGVNITTDKQIILIKKDGEETPIITKINCPEFIGAVIVCDGGDDPRIKYELTQATKSLTGISTDYILVTKMK